MGGFDILPITIVYTFQEKKRKKRKQGSNSNPKLGLRENLDVSRLKNFQFQVKTTEKTRLKKRKSNYKQTNPIYKYIVRSILIGEKYWIKNLGMSGLVLVCFSPKYNS